MSNVPVAHHFDSAEQQRESATLGMWGFLVTEVLFFGGLFASFTIYRHLNHPAFAEASHHLPRWLGATNLTVLLLSSLTMAYAVHATEHNDRRAMRRNLLFTVGCALVFLFVKSIEYYLDYEHHLIPGTAFRAGWEHSRNGAQLFFIHYFVMTGLHALHVIIGLGVILVTLVIAQRKKDVSEAANLVEMVGLYWHLVDCVWIVLFPLLYLSGA